jgi:hypothetical protein
VGTPLARLKSACTFDPDQVLDLDDTNGFGPEHYFVGCQTLLAGPYRMGVSDFFGTGPETATVVIKAGDVVSTSTIPLAQAVGGAGDSAPTGSPSPCVQRVVTIQSLV